MMFPRYNRTTALYSLLMGSSSVCSITVDAAGAVTGTRDALTVGGDGVVTSQGAPKEVTSADALADPAAPPPTPEEEAAAIAKARENETPEQKTEREAAEAAEANETTRRAALTEEERTAEDAVKQTADAEAKNKAWLERDKTKDVPLQPEQEAHILKLGSTPEQQELLREFTLETNTTNDLSPASRAKAAAAWNVTPEMVDQYVESVIATNKAVLGKDAEAVVYDDTSEDQSKWSPDMKAQFDSRMAAVQNAAGSPQNWADFATWAEKGLTAPEKEALQAAISASPIVGATVAEKFLARWRAEGNGGGPVDVSRGAGAGARPVKQAAPGFANRAEQNDAINDPRYARDENYRAGVDAKIINSDFSQQGLEKAFFGGAMMVPKGN